MCSWEILSQIIMSPTPGSRMTLGWKALWRDCCFINQLWTLFPTNSLKTRNENFLQICTQHLQHIAAYKNQERCTEPITQKTTTDSEVFHRKTLSSYTRHSTTNCSLYNLVPLCFAGIFQCLMDQNKSMMNLMTSLGTCIDTSNVTKLEMSLLANGDLAKI
jgi:hypothetical protein